MNMVNRGNGKDDASVLRNGRLILYVLSLYCNYESLLIDNNGVLELCNMSNLPKVVMRDDCPLDVQNYFNNLKQTSTPLFDLTAGYWSLGNTSDKSMLPQLVVDNLISLSQLTAGFKKRTRSRSRNRSKRNHSKSRRSRMKRKSHQKYK